MGNEEEDEYKLTPNADNLNIQEFENKINSMLDNIWSSDIESICDEFNEFIYKNCMDLKTIEILMGCIVIHGVNNKPVFFGTKYSLLSQSIISFINNNQNINKNINKKINLYDIAWQC